MRASGILLPVYSLPSPYGIGTFGKAAYEFADFLESSGQTFWQMLPLGPTSYGDSPYQSFSAFAGNPYLIDPDMLIDEGLLTTNEVKKYDFGSNPRYVDYGKIYASRFELLSLAKERGWERDKVQIATFVSQNERWLTPYVRFMGLKKLNGMKSWFEWDKESGDTHETEELFTYIQYLFFKQWDKLKSYVNALGIRIIGDLPIYVSMDSADVWSERELFLLGSDNLPIEVAGVPPDYFSENGQLWGNPLYNYEKMQSNGYEWWIRRLGAASRLFDVIRLDHFRGFESFWAVPYGQDTAKKGRWIKGPGISLIKTFTDWFHDIDFIAEDLGILTPNVRRLLDASGLPGMKVLEFAFDASKQSSYLPHAHRRNCICYTGTHDNPPIELWLREAPPADLDFCVKYLGLNESEGYAEGIIRGGMSSVADTFICQMQDYLHLGEGSRTNTPGVATGNWMWRLLPGETTPSVAKHIFDLTKRYGRLPEKNT